MSTGLNLVRYVDDFRIARQLRLAEKAGLDFYSAGVHYEKAGFRLRFRGQEAEAVKALRASSWMFEIEALARAPFVRNPLFMDGLSKESRRDRVLECLDRAADNAMYSDEADRYARLRGMADKIKSAYSTEESLRLAESLSLAVRS